MFQVLIAMCEKENLQGLTAHIRPATISDACLIESLLKKGAEKGSVLFRSTAEISKVIDGFVVLDDPEKPELIACASVEVYDEVKVDLGNPGLAELRSVVSLRPGVGPLIVAEALEKPKKNGIKDIFATTDNPLFFIEKCGFEYKKGGIEIAWMNMEGQSGTVFDGSGVTVREATTDDITVLSKLLAQDEENVLPVSENALQHSIKSYYLAINKSQQVIGCSGAFIYSASVPGGRPRMAEVKGLIIDNGFEKAEIQNILLNYCWHKFKDAYVVQAFVTGTSSRRKEMIDSGYFSDVKGGKQVIWYSGGVK